MTAIEVVLAVGLILASISDIRTGLIRNNLTGSLMLIGIVLNARLGYDSGDLMGGIATAIIGIGIMMFVHGIVLFNLGVERGGDVKLFMAIGGLVGWREAAEASLWTAIVYIPVSLVVLAVRGRLGNLLATARWMARGRPADSAPEPTVLRTAPVIAVGAVLAHVTSTLM